MMRIRVLPDTDFACGLYCRYKNFFLTKILALELKVLHICRSFKSFFSYIISRFFKLTKVWRVFESGSKSQNVRFGSATLNVLKNMPSTVCGIYFCSFRFNSTINRQYVYVRKWDVQ